MTQLYKKNGHWIQWSFEDLTLLLLLLLFLLMFSLLLLLLQHYGHLFFFLCGSLSQQSSSFSQLEKLLQPHDIVLIPQTALDLPVLFYFGSPRMIGHLTSLECFTTLVCLNIRQMWPPPPPFWKVLDKPQQAATMTTRESMNYENERMWRVAFLLS